MLLITCPHWLTSVLNNELKKLWYSSQDSFETWTFVDAGLTDAYNINLRSRIANKVFLRLNTPNICTDFDDLYDQAHTLDRAQYIWIWQGISVKVHIRQSNNDSAKSSQAIVQKAILTKLTGSKDKDRHIDIDRHTHTIFVVINKNICSFYINTSWQSLHQRWYRWEAGKAPLKENIAAALVQLAGWNFKKPLMDPCCGSGTICIEAAMIARNIAPWLQRYFAFEKFPCFESDVFKKLREEAKTKIYKGDYTIMWSDIDEDVLALAQENADHVWVWDTIVFKYGDLTKDKDRETPLSTQDLTVITNPPYGKRLWPEDLEHIDLIHETLATSLTHKTILITGAEEVKWFFAHKDRSAKQTKNGPDDATIYISK